MASSRQCASYRPPPTASTIITEATSSATNNRTISTTKQEQGTTAIKPAYCAAIIAIMSPPTANPTTGKTHVAEKEKYHEGGSLKAYSHEELGTADDVRSFLFYFILFCWCVALRSVDVGGDVFRSVPLCIRVDYCSCSAFVSLNTSMPRHDTSQSATQSVPVISFLRITRNLMLPLSISNFAPLILFSMQTNYVHTTYCTSNKYWLSSNNNTNNILKFYHPRQ